MTTQPQHSKRAYTYARDMSNDGPEQINLDGKPRPPELQKIMKDAKKKPRQFDVLVVAKMTVLGTPSQAQTVINELAEFGIEVKAADGSTH